MQRRRRRWLVTHYLCSVEIITLAQRQEKVFEFSRVSRTHSSPKIDRRASNRNTDLFCSAHTQSSSSSSLKCFFPAFSLVHLSVRHRVQSTVRVYDDSRFDPNAIYKSPTCLTFIRFLVVVVVSVTKYCTIHKDETALSVLALLLSSSERDESLDIFRFALFLFLSLTLA